MEQELLQEIASYWGTRAEGYSEVNEKELAGSQREAWLHVLEEKKKRKIWNRNYYREVPPFVQRSKKERSQIEDGSCIREQFPEKKSKDSYDSSDDFVEARLYGDGGDYTEMLEKAKRESPRKIYEKIRSGRVTLQQMDAQIWSLQMRPLIFVISEI